MGELYRYYIDSVVPRLRLKHGYSNPHDIPRIKKVVINSCVSTSISDHKQAIEEIRSEIATISGQAPTETRAKKSIANFKLRKGQVIGVKVTLRGMRMYEFLERLILMGLPRIRDFRGVRSKSFDGHGNYTLGVNDQTIFPEIELDKVKRAVGFDITIVTSALTDLEAKSLLTEIGMPFSDKAQQLKGEDAK